jgi:hypothetical protein
MNCCELDMDPAAPKPEPASETIRQFDSLEVGAGLFRLTPAAFRRSECAFFLIGTAEPPKAIRAGRSDLKAYASPN